MNNNILFIYSDSSEKSLIEECVIILKAVFKRFRQKLTFSKFFFDYASCARSEALEKLLLAIKNADAVVWDCPSAVLEEELNFAVKNLGMCAQVSHLNGRSIVSPLFSRTLVRDESSFSHSLFISKKAAEKSALLAVTLAKTAERRIEVCTNFEHSSYGKMLCDIFTDTLTDVRGIDISFISYSELIWKTSQQFPSFGVLLAGEQESFVAFMNMCALKKLPSGYTVWHGENMRIYKRAVLPYEELSNFTLASILYCCAAMIANELSLENISAHIKSCTSLALEQCANFSTEDFKSSILFHIQKPIRNRQVKTYEADTQ